MKRRTQRGPKDQRQARAQRPVQAEQQLVRMEKPVYGGAFLGRVEGKAIFVPLTLPGELVRARIVEDRRSYANAEAAEIPEQAAERIAPECKHFGACGGCHYQHAPYARQIEIKKAILRETLERAGVQAPAEMKVLAGAPWGYRNRIRLAVDGGGRVGYRGRRSHALVAMEECPIAAPLLVRAARVFSALVQQHGAACEEVALFCNGDESQMLGSVTAAQGKAEAWTALATEWAQAIPELTGVHAQRMGRPPQVIAAWGELSLDYVAAGETYRVDHGAFFQVNRWLVDGLVETVTHGLRGEAAWDLYAGVGLFARRLGSSFARVRAVEFAGESARALAHNLQGRGGEAVTAGTLEFLESRAHERPDAIVVDPPRAGLGAEIAAPLGKVAAPQLVYVSCDPATLARDLRALAASGYAIEELTMADLFPQTFHIETIARLRRG